ncbi:MAG: DUF559 domain-containing protein, partial [Phaeodactylibacter sp.]|nr:DUF559 domain-containing protein [Phaeodactylibacter sp.]
VIGLFPANTVNDDDIEVYTDESRTEVKATLHMLRQQRQKAPGLPNMSLADFIAPASPQPPPKEGELAKGGLGYQTADPIGYGYLKDFAKQQRSNPTEAEKLLWQHLRGKALGGYKFRRQHIIDQFIADFICLKQRLIIEVDGNIHQLPDVKLKDEQRTQRLNELGFQVIRFTNEQVLGDVDAVLATILTTLETPTPLPSPLRGDSRGAPPPLRGGWGGLPERRTHASKHAVSAAKAGLSPKV